MKLKPLFTNQVIVIIATQLVITYEWIHGGLEKTFGGKFIASIGTTLSRFADGNPHALYVDSVLQAAQNSPQVFGQLVQWGELFTGIGLLLAIMLFYLAKAHQAKMLARCIAVTALLGGVIMNLNFYFAAGWLSPSTSGVNVLMFWVQIILIYHWFTISKK